MFDYIEHREQKNITKENQTIANVSSHVILTWVSFFTRPSFCNRMIMACLETFENPPVSLTFLAIIGQVSTLGS